MGRRYSSFLQFRPVAPYVYESPSVSHVANFVRWISFIRRQSPRHSSSVILYHIVQYGAELSLSPRCVLKLEPAGGMTIVPGHSRIQTFASSLKHIRLSPMRRNGHRLTGRAPCWCLQSVHHRKRICSFCAFHKINRACGGRSVSLIWRREKTTACKYAKKILVYRIHVFYHHKSRDLTGYHWLY